MTFDEYIKNPMQSSVMSNRAMYKEMYTSKWDKIKVKENGLILYTLYKDSKSYYIHYKIPSEVVPKFYYDVIIQFYPPKGKEVVEKEKTLQNYDIRVFSNDPSFVYTFCYAFNSRKMFINDLDSKMNKYALTHKAPEKNPKNELGYVKSLYFAYLETKANNLFAKVSYEVKAKPYTKKEILSNVMHADDKIAARQAYSNAADKKEKREKNREKNIKTGKSEPVSSYISPNAKALAAIKNGISAASRKITHPFESPNIKNYGHLKKK